MGEHEGVDGKVVLITGAGQGIGRGMALHLGKHGAKVVVAEWKAHRVERVVGELRDLGVDALGVECNILEQPSIDAAVADTVDHYGRIDGLINNAHTFTAKVPIADVGEEDMDLNHGTVKGTLWAMQAVRPHMKAQGWGRIVNFVSAAGITGMAEYGAYNASKEAIRALTRTAARVGARRHRRQRDRSRRGLEARARGGRCAEAEYRDYLRDHPMGRQGDPEEDIGPVALFLCSDGCRFLTGQTFMVDGGAFIHA